jgi:hypothetical protein
MSVDAFFWSSWFLKKQVGACSRSHCFPLFPGKSALTRGFACTLQTPNFSRRLHLHLARRLGSAPASLLQKHTGVSSILFNPIGFGLGLEARGCGSGSAVGVSLCLVAVGLKLGGRGG